MGSAVPSDMMLDPHSDTSVPRRYESMKSYSYFHKGVEGRKAMMAYMSRLGRKHDMPDVRFLLATAFSI